MLVSTEVLVQVKKGKPVVSPDKLVDLVLNLDNFLSGYVPLPYQLVFHLGSESSHLVVKILREILLHKLVVKRMTAPVADQLPQPRFAGSCGLSYVDRGLLVIHYIDARPGEIVESIVFDSPNRINLCSEPGGELEDTPIPTERRCFVNLLASLLFAFFISSVAKLLFDDKSPKNVAHFDAFWSCW